MSEEEKKERIVPEEEKPDTPDAAPGTGETEERQPAEAAAEQAEAAAPEAETAAPETEAAGTEAAGEAPEDDGAETLRRALEDAEKQRDDYLALAQRAQADYQNLKRRTGAVRTEAYDDGVRETIAAMLPVIDNLERAIAAAEGANDALVSGVQMTLRQMLETLTRMGLEEVPALGEKFDPDIHNAVMRAPAGEGEPGVVLEVFQKGYRVKDRMIRYAMVKIAAED